MVRSAVVSGGEITKKELYKRMKRTAFCVLQQEESCFVLPVSVQGYSDCRIGGNGMTDDEKRMWACTQLREKADQLGNAPKKSDFDPVQLSRIKAILGPWPRALECAGLKACNKVPKKSHPRKTRQAKKKVNANGGSQKTR